MRIARSRYFGSMYFSHRSGGSRICPSQSIISSSVFIVLAPHYSVVISTGTEYLKNSERIYRRCGPALEDQRRHREQELVAAESGCCRRHGVEVGVVDQVDAHRDQSADV